MAVRFIVQYPTTPQQVQAFNEKYPGRGLILNDFTTAYYNSYIPYAGIPTRQEELNELSGLTKFKTVPSEPPPVKKSQRSAESIPRLEQRRQ